MGRVIDINQGIGETIQREPYIVKVLGKGIVDIAKIRDAGEGVVGNDLVIHAAHILVITDAGRAAFRARLDRAGKDPT
jgi:hypothetical protein